MNKLDRQVNKYHQKPIRNSKVKSQNDDHNANLDIFVRSRRAMQRPFLSQLINDDNTDHRQTERSMLCDKEGRTGNKNHEWKAL